MRYAIWAPAYRHKSGGIRALHVLCDELRKRDQDATIMPMDSAWAPSPFDAPEYDHADTTPALHVYPEIITNQPGEGPCVRWLLNKATVDGVVFGWLPSMGYSVLHVPIIDTHAFYPRTGRRSGVGVWVGKGSFDASRVPDGATRIGIGWPDDPHALGDLLGGFEYVISFDPFSSLVAEATMCGTPVRVHATDQWSRAELEANPFEPPVGVAFTDDELVLARASAQNAFGIYTSRISSMLATVDSFVEATQFVD